MKKKNNIFKMDLALWCCKWVDGWDWDWVSLFGAKIICDKISLIILNVIHKIE